MKPVIFLYVFFSSLFWSYSCLSQITKSSFVHLDRIPSEGILLDKGWKFHNGDDLLWAKPGYNDNNWQPADLSNFSSYFPAFKKKGVGWFRLKFIMDSSLRKNTTLVISQFGSCDLYINGSMFVQFGDNTLPNQAKVDNPNKKPFLFDSNLRGDTVTLAVRFASKLPVPIWLFPTHEVAPLSIKITPWLTAVNNYGSSLLHPRARIGFSFMSLCLGLLFILLYSLFPKERINLLFGLFCLLLSTTAVIEFQLSEGNLNMAEYGLISFASQLIDKTCGMLIISIISLEILNKITVYQRVLIFYITIIDTLLYLFFGNSQADLIASNIVRFLFTIELLRLGFYGIKKDNYIISIVSISSGIRNISFFLSSYILINISGFYYFFNWILCIVMVTFYLATKFARYSRNLVFQLVEIKDLSDANFKNEQEKQQILTDRLDALEKLDCEKKNSVQALSDVRQVIALDLHDEIGSTLNSISVYSEVARRQLLTNLENAGNLLNKMGNASRNMIDKMNDIVWAVNPKNDQFENILERMQYFAGELLSGKDIVLKFDIEDAVKNVILPMEIRKNFYLIFKEAINNSYKYADGKSVKVSIALDEINIVMLITDDGTGVEVANRGPGGNGLINMQIRASEINAQLKIKSCPKEGTRVELRVPLK